MTASTEAPRPRKRARRASAVARPPVPYLQATPLALILGAFLLLPILMIAVVSFWDYDFAAMYPDFLTDQLHRHARLVGHLENLSQHAEIRGDRLGADALHRLLGRLFPRLPHPHRGHADGAVPGLHRAVPDLQHHPHDLVDPGARPQRAGQFDAGRRWASIPAPIEWLLYSEFAVVLAMVHLYTLFMVTPIFNTLMRIDRSLIEAARDAGATGWQVLWNVIIPLAKPGMAIGTIFVVTLVMADFSTVQVMSGGQSASVALMMKNQMSLLQYPAAAANAVVLLVLVLLMVAGILRVVDIRKEL